MKSIATSARVIVKAVVLLCTIFSVECLAVPPSAKEAGVTVGRAAQAVAAAVKADFQVKGVLAKLERATPATTNVLTEALKKAKSTLEAARKVARTRIDQATTVVDLVQTPKTEVDKLKARIADLNTRMAAIPVY